MRYPPAMALVMVGCGLITIVSLARAARRTTGGLRRMWQLFALSIVFYAIACAGAALDHPVWSTWVLPHLGAKLAMIMALQVSPGFRRSTWDWFPVLLDGAIVTLSALNLMWAGLTYLGHSTNPFEGAVALGLGWITLDLFALSMAIGLLIRLQEHRRSAVLGVTSLFFVLCTDLCWGRTGDVLWGSIFAAAAALALGASALHPFEEPFGGAAVERVRPQPSRRIQLMGLPAVLVALTPWGTDPVACVVAGTTVVLVLARLVFLDRVNSTLMAQVGLRAQHDALTGMLNRHGLMATTMPSAACAMINLDDFKTVNDIHGHTVGDSVLVRVARHLEQLTPDGAVARLGGDQFSVHPKQAQWDAFCVNVFRALASDSACLGVTASIGISSAAPLSLDAGLQEASMALASAKQAGGGRWRSFEPVMRWDEADRTQTQARVRRAAQRSPLWEAAQCPSPEGLELDLQPVVSLTDGSWGGVEALIRFRADGQRQFPDHFLPKLDSTTSNQLGSWVLRRSLEWLKHCAPEDFTVAVNVTAAQILQIGFAREVTDALAATGIAPNRLTLEITEQTPMNDITRAQRTLAPLRAQGIHLSLDDFGTGFSSLGHLRTLTVDAVKIDKSFVVGIGRDSHRELTVQGVLALAVDLGLDVVGEGVETREQAEALHAWGADHAQGYLFSRPIPDHKCHPPVMAGGALDEH